MDLQSEITAQIVYRFACMHVLLCIYFENYLCKSKNTWLKKPKFNKYDIWYSYTIGSYSENFQPSCNFICKHRGCMISKLYPLSYLRHLMFKINIGSYYLMLWLLQVLLCLLPDWNMHWEEKGIVCVFLTFYFEHFQTYEELK